MLQFCDGNNSLSHPWVAHGLSHCFIDTVSSSVLFGLLFIFGGLQLIMYVRYSTSVDRRFQPSSFLYCLQILFSVVMAIQVVARFILQAFFIGQKQIYLYMIVSGVLNLFAWPMSIGLILLERKKILPSIPTWGHGLVLLLFWTVAFANENLAFVSWLSPNWWFKLKR